MIHVAFWEFPSAKAGLPNVSGNLTIVALSRAAAPAPAAAAVAPAGGGGPSAAGSPLALPDRVLHAARHCLQARVRGKLKDCLGRAASSVPATALPPHLRAFKTRKADKRGERAHTAAPPLEMRSHWPAQHPLGNPPSRATDAEQQGDEGGRRGFAAGGAAVGGAGAGSTATCGVVCSRARPPPLVVLVFPWSPEPRHRSASAVAVLFFVRLRRQCVCVVRRWAMPQRLGGGAPVESSGCARHKSITHGTFVKARGTGGAAAPAGSAHAFRFGQQALGVRRAWCGVLRAWKNLGGAGGGAGWPWWPRPAGWWGSVWEEGVSIASQKQAGYGCSEGKAIGKAQAHLGYDIKGCRAKCEYPRHGVGGRACGGGTPARPAVEKQC